MFKMPGRIAQYNLGSLGVAYETYKSQSSFRDERGRFVSGNDVAKRFASASGNGTSPSDRIAEASRWAQEGSLPVAEVALCNEGRFPPGCRLPKPVYDATVGQFEDIYRSRTLLPMIGKDVEKARSFLEEGKDVVAKVALRNLSDMCRNNSSK